MSDIILQINFNTGVGDFYCTVTQVLNFAKFCTSQNLQVDIIYNYNRCNYFEDTEYDINNYFDIASNSQFFNSIQYTSIKEKIDGYTYIYTPYLYQQNMNPGAHWWDLFINNKNIKTTDFLMQNINLPCVRNNHRLNDECLPLFLSKKLRERSLESNVDYRKALHIRSYDCSDNLDIIKNNIDKINLILQEKTLISSNSLVIKSYFRDNTNAIIVDGRHPSVGYHFGEFKHKENINNKLIENFEDTLIDMHNLYLAKDLYSLTEWSRPSNFLFYILNNKRDIQIHNL